MTNWKPCLRQLILNLFIALANLYSVSIVLILMLRALVGEQWSLINLFNSFGHWLIMPALLLLPVVVVLRRGWLALLLAMPVVVFLWNYGIQFIPRSAVAMRDMPVFIVLTHNVYADTNDYAARLALIKQADADVVAFQELTNEASDYLANGLKTDYPYQAMHPQIGYAGQGILSKLPITSDDYWQLSRGHQRAVLQVGGKPITIYNIHPAPPGLSLTGSDSSLRGAEIDELLVRFQGESAPLLIIGDLNLTDLTDDYARLTASYHDVYREVGWGMGFTYPNFSATRARVNFVPALARIDYIFHDNNFVPLEARVLPDSGGSDHFPLYAVLALKQAPS
ncbi:MAG: endonuclease/exonuclease/phosphatase family protein [Anaerolineae bacterium]